MGGEAEIDPTISLSIELVTLLVQCDVPLVVHRHFVTLGITSVAKLAFCVSTDQELMEEVLGSMSDLLHHLLLPLEFHL